MIIYDKVINGKMCEVHLFDSPHEEVERVFHPDNAKTRNEYGIGNLRASFLGRDLRDWDQIKAAIDSEWTEGIEVIDKMIKECEDHIPKPQIRKRRMKWNDHDGDEIDIDRLRAGTDYWRMAHRPFVYNHGQAVTLLIHAGGNSFQNSMDLMWPGAASTVIAHQLEKSGYRTEVWTVSNIKGLFTNGDGCVTATKIKELSQPLDISTLATAISGWYYRSIVMLSEGISHSGREPTVFYGQNVTITPIVGEISKDKDIIVCTNVYNKTAAKSFVETTLSKFKEKAK